MMNGRNTIILATVSNALCDTVLDYSVNRFNYYKVLFFTAVVAMMGQLIVGSVIDITLSFASLPYVFIHAVAILAGYICFVKSLKYIPIALAGLIETSSLFLTFLIDAFVGYISISFYFVLLLGLFVFSVFLFTDNCRQEVKNCAKTLKPVGFFYILVSILLYLTAPYLVKLANVTGANEIAINLGYYGVAIPYFMYQSIKWKHSEAPAVKPIKWWQNFYFLCCVIGILEALYYVFETMSFINDIPTVVILIAQMRVFLLFILSVLFGTDKFTGKKLLALVLGSIAVIGVYFT